MSLSARVVQGSWWRTLGIIIMIWLLAGLPTIAVTLLFASATAIAANLAVAAVSIVVVPFTGAALTLLFFDLQSREREHAGIA